MEYYVTYNKLKYKRVLTFNKSSVQTQIKEFELFYISE